MSPWVQPAAPSVLSLALRLPEASRVGSVAMRPQDALAHSPSRLAFWFTFLSFKFSQLISPSSDASAAQGHLSGCAARGGPCTWSCFIWPIEDSSPSGRKGIVLILRRSKVTHMLPALVSLVPTAVLEPRAGAGTLGSQAWSRSVRRGLARSAPALLHMPARLAQTLVGCHFLPELTTYSHFCCS